MTPAAEIVAWTCAELAELLDRPPEKIDPNLTFAQLGMDSGSATHLLLALEDRYRIEVDPEAALELPSIAALGSYIAALVAKREAAN